MCYLKTIVCFFYFFFSSRRRHTRLTCDWSSDVCSSDLAGVVPLQDLDAAIVEMRRCVEQLGFKAIMLRPAAYRDNQKLNHPDYDPFWDAAAGLSCPIGIHPSP